MKIGILSDSHNDIDHLAAALKILDRESIHVVICCGDVVDAACVPLFAGLELHLVEGNMDTHPQDIVRSVTYLGNDSTFGLEYQAVIDNKRIVAMHGHHEGRLNEAVRSGDFDYVFHGHTHRRRDERVNSTRVINPGALGGTRHESRSIAILDLTHDDLHVIEITP